MDEKNDLRAQLREKYGDAAVAVERPAHGLFVFERPSAVAYGRFRAAVTKKGADSAAATQQLCTDCLVYPRNAEDRPDYPKALALFDAYPALPDSLSGKLVDLAGGSDDLLGKL